MKKILLVLVSVLALSSVFGQEESKGKKEIIGYFPNWHHWKTHLYTPKHFDFSKYTIINYSFMSPDKDGNIVQNDPFTDSWFLEGEIDWENTVDPDKPAYVPYTNMVDQCHAVGTKVMMSLGGWTLSTEFPIVADDPAKRTHFAEECVRICEKWNLDGIDLDWEFPGASPGNGTIHNVNDTKNFNLMIDEIRDSLDALEKRNGRYYMLTAAFHSVPSLAKHIDWDHVSKTLDYVNLFGYDFGGAWNELSSHNAPLYAYGCSDSLVNQHDGFMLLVDYYGVPREKIVLGIGFYGRTTTGFKDGTPGLCEPHAGIPDGETFARTEGTPMYRDILLNSPLFERKWDDDAQVPYMLGRNLNSFASYDDQRSVRIKAEHICDEKSAGCLIWDVMNDFIEVPVGSGQVHATPLLDMINEVFYLEQGYNR